jgi:hypothetical protein
MHRQSLKVRKREEGKEKKKKKTSYKMTFKFDALQTPGLPVLRSMTVYLFHRFSKHLESLIIQKS